MKNADVRRNEAREDAEELRVSANLKAIDRVRGFLREAIADLPLGNEVKSALLGEDNPARAILDIVIAYEAGQWDEATEKARALGLPDEAPAKIYAQALDWARELSRAAA